MLNDIILGKFKKSQDRALYIIYMVRYIYIYTYIYIYEKTHQSLSRDGFFFQVPTFQTFESAAKRGKGDFRDHSTERGCVADFLVQKLAKMDLINSIYPKCKDFTDF